MGGGIESGFTLGGAVLISAGQCRLVVHSVQPPEGGQKEPNPPKTMPPATPLAKVPYLFRRGKAPLAAGKPGQNGAVGLPPTTGVNNSRVGMAVWSELAIVHVYGYKVYLPALQPASGS